MFLYHTFIVAPCCVGLTVTHHDVAAAAVIPAVAATAHRLDCYFVTVTVSNRTKLRLLYNQELRSSGPYLWIHL